MSDVTIAPPSAAPSTPAPAPAAHEVPINPPAHTPNPVGSVPQTPAEHKGSEHRTPSRAEALKAAFDRAVDPPKTKPAAKAQPPAEAKKGHNQPPEETPTLNLKKPPGEQQPQPRDKGRFAPRQPEGNAEWNELAKPRTQQGQPDQSAQPYKKLEPHEPYAEPLPRMAESAKRDWANTPETVRGDIHRIHGEFSKAVQHYQATHAAYQQVAPYDQLARQQGTTLQQALSNYVSIEAKLRQDPIAALDTIVHNLGMVDPETKQRIGLRDIAYHVLSQTPEALRQVQQGNAQQAAQQQIGGLYKEVQGLKNTLQQWQSAQQAAMQQQRMAQQFVQTRSAVDVFADSHPRFDELGDLIEKELRLGFPLDQAYQRAELLRPATHAAQTRNPSAQTRTSDRSIHGNPDVAPSNGASRRPREASPTARTALANAMKLVNGSA
jgi:hypothetical protein